MDSLPEDVTMRTLIKGMIAEEVPQSIVRPRTHRLQKRTSTPKKITNISVHQSPSMVLHSKLKTEVARSLRKQIAGTAGSSKRHSIRRNSPALRKTKTAEPIPLEALDDYTPRGLLKKFIQTEPESSLVKVVNPKMKESAQKKSQPKTKLSSGSNDSFSLSLPAEDTTEQKLPIDRNLRKRKKISVSEFEKATQQRLQHTAEPQESEQVELYEKSTKLPDVSTIVGLINPDFEESTTKPILSRRPVKRKVINEDDFEEGVHNYLEQEKKEPEEIVRSGPFEKTAGLTDISGLVGSINVDTEESVSKPVLSRRQRRDKLISEDDFEEGVLFYLRQTKEKPFPEVQETSSDSTGKEKSSANTVQDELAVTELYTSPWPMKSDGMEAVSAGTEEMKNEFGLNSGHTLLKQTELSVPAEEECAKTAYTERASSHRLIKEKNFLTDIDHQMEYSADKITEDLQVDEESTDHDVQTQQGAREHQSEHGGSETAAIAQHSEKNKPDEEKETENDGDYQADYEELEMPKDTDQNLSTQGGQNPSAAPHSEGTDIDGGVLVDEMGGKRVAGEEVNEARVDDGVLVVEVSEARVEGDDVNDRMEGDDVNDRMEGDDVNDRMEGDDVNDRMEGDDVNDRMEGDDVNDRMEGDDVNDGMEGDDVNDGMEGDDVNDGVLVDEVSETRVEGDEGMEFDEKTEGDEVDDERVEGDGVEDEEVEPNEVDEREESIDDSEDDSKVRPTFQQSDKVFRSSPLLTTPHFLKILARKAQKPLAKVKQNPKKPIQKQKKTILPSSFVKSVFSHYAKMKVKKEAFTAVEKCLELYFKQLCEDVDVYSKHAKRKTIEKEDLELLMKRQGFVTAKTPLNVLIEHHLPMECREKLIPMAVSGSKIIPKK
ncbi:centromere protein T isoform X2 [Heptranchias perlo]|uniref:centromere protein T isoform X2 n=1 Tax=Heptranchias perlo TaxID=212740 RepID=UPI00355A1209